MATNIITYGFNSKATITISSIKEESTMLCIQRSIKGVNNNIIEEQEFNINIERNNVNKLYNVLVIFTILSIYGEFLKKIQKKLTFYVDKTREMLYNSAREILDTENKRHSR